MGKKLTPPTLAEKRAAAKLAEKQPPKIPEIGQAPAALVAPLDQQAFQYAIKLIDSAPMVGGEAGNIIMLKRELARVAGIQQTQQPG